MLETWSYNKVGRKYPILRLYTKVMLPMEGLENPLRPCLHTLPIHIGTIWQPIIHRIIPRYLLYVSLTQLIPTLYPYMIQYIIMSSYNQELEGKVFFFKTRGKFHHSISGIPSLDVDQMNVNNKIK
uniref:Uncharacterized protein n=1 Tax=Cacopsylla melanoneura TaxID=428564 RepID=A0A8D8ZB85_9HEMI